MRFKPHRELTGLKVAIQFLIACTVGCWAFWITEGEPYKARLVIAFVLGHGAAWLLTWLYARVRFGRGVRVTMDMR